MGNVQSQGFLDEFMAVLDISRVIVTGAPGEEAAPLLDQFGAESCPRWRPSRHLHETVSSTAGGTASARLVPSMAGVTDYVSGQVSTWYSPAETVDDGRRAQEANQHMTRSDQGQGGEQHTGGSGMRTDRLRGNTGH